MESIKAKKTKREIRNKKAALERMKAKNPALNLLIDKFSLEPLKVEKA